MTNLTTVQRIRQEMPATTAHIYLNTGTFGPLPQCVPQAIQTRLQEELRHGRLGTEGFARMAAIYNEARTSIARLLHTHQQDIALTDNTGEGLNIICHGLNWQKGDEVITTNHEHISALAPLYQIRDRYGITIRLADIGPRADRPALEAILPLITPRTRLIVLSHITWTTGAVIDIASVGRMAQERGIPVLIDGAQAAGVIPLHVKELNIDFYAMPMQKWLCGPDGTGALYARQEALRYILSTYVGYFSIKHEEGIEWELLDTAQRFELGGRQTAALAGQSAVLNWMENTVGYEWIYTRIAELHTYAYHALKEVPGLTMLTPQPGASGIISFQLAGQDDNKIVDYLKEKHNIYIRNVPTIHALRVSTGFYNTEEEIDTLVQAITKL